MASELFLELYFFDEPTCAAWLATTIDLSPLPEGALVGRYFEYLDDEETEINETTELAEHWNETVAQAQTRQALEDEAFEPRSIERAISQLGVPVSRKDGGLVVKGHNEDVSFRGEVHLIKALHVAAGMQARGRLVLCGVSDMDYIDDRYAFTFELADGVITSDQIEMEDALNRIGFHEKRG